MVTQKVIKIGNSYGAIIPIDILKSVGLKLGDEVEMEVIKDTNIIAISPKKNKNKIMKKIELNNWLNKFTKENKGLLKELAKY